MPHELSNLVISVFLKLLKVGNSSKFTASFKIYLDCGQLDCIRPLPWQAKEERSDKKPSEHPKAPLPDLFIRRSRCPDSGHLLPLLEALPDQSSSHSNG